MTTKDEIQEIAKEVYEYQKAERKKRSDRENVWITIFIAGMVIALTIGLAYITVNQDKNNVDMSHTALSYMSCGELKSLMQEENKNHSNDNLYSYAIQDIHNEILGKC